MNDIIGQILGGAGGSATTGNSMADGILKGGGPMSGILGMVLGGGGSSFTNNMVGSVVKGFTDKLGLPPIAAQIATAFVVSKIAGDKTAPSGAKQSGILDVLGHVAGGGNINAQTPGAGDILKELAGATGMKPEQASTGLESILGGLLKAVAQ